MTPQGRAVLQQMAEELLRLEAQAKAEGDAFLAFLIGSAAGEAADELRDERLAAETGPVARSVMSHANDDRMP